MSLLWSVGPWQGGGLPWAPRPHGPGGPAGGAGLVLGSVLLPPQLGAVGVSTVPGSPQPSRGSSCCSCWPLFQSPYSSPWALPLPVGSLGWGWPQGTGLVTIGTAWEVAVGACSHPQSCPAAQPRVVACPLCGCSVCPHCVFQCWQRSQCPGALSRPHVSTPGAPAASGFAFPSLHPGLLLYWWWLGLLWL